MDDNERVEYESYQKSLHNQASAYESTYVIGTIEGAKKEKLEIATNLLKTNIDIKIIKSSTGLTHTELLNLLGAS
jgi:predicted transposase/invertase (TIGR01784 family)